MTDKPVTADLGIIDSPVGAVVYACENSAWRAYNELLSAGLQVGSNLRVLKVPCSGRVDEVVMLRAVEDGARGVLVLGCPEDSCRFLQGNLRAKKRSSRTASALQDIDGFVGLVQYDALSGTSSGQLLNIITGFVDDLDELVTEEAVEQ